VTIHWAFCTPTRYEPFSAHTCTWFRANTCSDFAAVLILKQDMSVRLGSERTVVRPVACSAGKAVHGLQYPPPATGTPAGRSSSPTFSGRHLAMRPSRSWSRPQSAWTFLAYRICIHANLPLPAHDTVLSTRSTTASRCCIGVWLALAAPSSARGFFGGSAQHRLDSGAGLPLYSCRTVVSTTSACWCSNASRLPSGAHATHYALSFLFSGLDCCASPCCHWHP